MKILKKIEVPTGTIMIARTENNKLVEFLFVGDYGKDANIKADFLGITRELNGVPNGDIEPLSEKIVVTISTQAGCSMGCKFCDVPKVGPGFNLTYSEIMNQIEEALLEANRSCNLTETKRLNIHFARMGEPTFNEAVLAVAYNIGTRALSLNSASGIKADVIHPVVSTMMPKNNKNLLTFLQKWVSIKNNLYNGDAGLQFSINSTDENQRRDMFNNNALALQEVANIASQLPDPLGRKYTLNFALADEYIIDEKLLVSLFPTDRFICKITPLHRTTSSETNGIVTTEGYESFTPYKEVESRLKAVGYDVIVFVPSYDEDNGLITCGNAILTGKLPTSDYEITEYSPSV